MKRIIRAIGGYAILTALFATLLALELCFIAGAIVPVAGIVFLVTAPISPKDDVGLTIWRVAMVAIFGLMALLSGAGAALLLHFSVTGWKSAPRQPADPTASAS